MNLEKKHQLGRIRDRFPKAADTFSDVQHSLQRFFSGFEGLNFMKGFSPACDIIDTGQAYRLTADVPGMKQEDLHVEIQDRNLVISGERHEEKKSDRKSAYRVERRYGSFRRSILLPTEVDVDHIQATFQDGVLKIEIPKGEKAQAHTIPISEKKVGSALESGKTDLNAGSSTPRWGMMEPKSVSDSHH